jgi:hypothetical protein
MKTKFISAFLLLLVHTVNSQQLMSVLDPSGTSALDRNRLENKKKNIAGTPFDDEKYMPAKISGVNEVAMIRYNAYVDQIEVEVEGATYNLPKKDEYNQIVFVGSNKTISLKSYTDSKGVNTYGYLYEIASGTKSKVYLKKIVILTPEKEPISSYDSYVPAKYNSGNDEYYFELNGQIKFMPKGKKDLIALFPNKKSEIQSFLKQNKISFKDESDIIKLSEFLGSLN